MDLPLDRLWISLLDASERTLPFPAAKFKRPPTRCAGKTLADSIGYDNAAIGMNACPIDMAFFCAVSLRTLYRSERTKRKRAERKLGEDALLKVEGHAAPAPVPGVGGQSAKPRRPWWRQQYVQVIIGALLGVLIGWLSPTFATALKPLGDIFINLIRVTITPLVFLVVVTGIAQAGNMRSVGRIGFKTIIYFETVTTLCLMIGGAVALVVEPGRGVAEASSEQAASVAQYAHANVQSLPAYIMHIVPETLVGPFAQGDVLQVLVIALLTGAGLLMLGETGAPLRTSFERLNGLIFAIVNIVLLAAPIGAFGAMAFTVGKFGLSTIWALALLVLTAWCTLAVFVLVVLGVICRIAGVRLSDVLRLLREELLVVLGTSSSETAIPGMMRKLPAAGVPSAVTGLVIPSGYSFNLDGVALTLPLSVLFIAQVYGVRLTLEQEIGSFILMLFTSKGAAGVTGGAFGALAATVVATGVVPVEGLALLLSVDRFMSLGRSIVNTVGNAVAAVVVARWDGDFNEKAWDEAVASVRSGRDASRGSIAD
jgi:aerobic C4-dicarboxylate transport protein